MRWKIGVVGKVTAFFTDALHPLISISIPVPFHKKTHRHAGVLPSICSLLKKKSSVEDPAI